MFKLIVVLFALQVSTSLAGSAFLNLFQENKADDELFELPLIHYNDFHARFVQTSWTSGTCQNATSGTCVGGIARLYTAVMEEMKRENAILLNAGDNFQGTLFYTLHKWNITVEFMNKLPHDAMGLGNHEFDDKIAGVVDYLKTLNCSVLAANIDDSEEVTFQNLTKDYIIIERGGRSIGIIGYMLSTTNEISSTEKLKFTDEIEAVKSVAAELKKKGINIIIGLSHSGIDVDVKVAEAVDDLDVIVGGHSHTLLYTGDPPGGDKAWGEYPYVVTRPSGHKTLIVQASAYTKYLGNLTLFFDKNGDVAKWNGNPILLDATIVEDPDILKDLEPWKEAVDSLGGIEIGNTSVLLDASNGACYKSECNIGNFITDAMVHEYVGKNSGEGWTFASIAVTNAGGIRTSIDALESDGVITFGDLAQVMPFQNTFDVVELQGKIILEVLEFQVSTPSMKNKQFRDFSTNIFLQWSGIRVTFDVAQPRNKRVQPQVLLLCNECRVPKYEPLDPEKWYRIVMNSFLADGGDGYSVITANIKNRTYGRMDTDVMQDYIQNMSPITHGMDGRIKVIETYSGGFGIVPNMLVVLASLYACVMGR